MKMGVRCQLIGRVICGAGSGYFMREDRRGMGGGKSEGKKKRKKKGKCTNSSLEGVNKQN